MLLQRVKNDIVHFGLIEKGDKVLLGVSGGMDSIALLECLCHLQTELSFQLEVAHLNHMIRGENAFGDAEFVRTECEKRNIRCHMTKRDIPSLAKEKGMGLEECAREERYQFFRTLGADKIAVAHHADDQAETVLMHLLRGSGADGLSGMRWKSGDIIRPFLGVRRKEIEAFIQKENLSWREDETNRSEEYFRNRLRHQVMPLLEELQVGAAEKIVACAKKVEEDNAFLWELARKGYHVVQEEENRRSISVDALIALPLPVRKRVLRTMLSGVGFVGETGIHECEKLLWGESGKQVSLPNGFVAERVYDTFFVRKKTESFPFSIQGAVGEETLLPDGRILFVGETEEAGLLVDGEKIPSSFRVRSRNEGDKFVPGGMSGNKKLKDFFIDEKIPREKREKAVILEGEQGIFAVLPYRVSEGAKCTENTKKILKITLKGQE